MTNTRFIYHIVDVNECVRYVGCSVNPYRRLAQHYSESDGSRFDMNRFRYAFHQWLDRERTEGRWASVRIVSVSRSDWRIKEIAEISRCLRNGINLLNSQNTGRPRLATSEAWRLKTPEEYKLHCDMIRRGHRTTKKLERKR